MTPNPRAKIYTERGLRKSWHLDERKYVTFRAQPTPTQAEGFVMNQHLRSLLPAVLLLCVGCPRTAVEVGTLSDAATGSNANGVVSQTDITVLVQPPSELDILFMVDNSPSMDTKQEALAKTFPALIKVLETMEGGLPDLHIGVISSDLGAGGGELGDNCGVPLGNRGLLWGNDSSESALKGVTDSYNQFATVAKLSNGCGLSQGARWIQDIRSTATSGRLRNYSGDLTDVFSCLAKGVGTGGCGEEHPLQSIRLALNPQKDINEANIGFLRPNARLAIVMVTDEDDCSADPNSFTDRTPNNDGLFTPNGLATETTSLRCAGRGHVCNGKAIPGYDPSNGYTAASPLSLNFADCAAKEPKDPPDYHWLPLIPVQTFIDEILAVKNGNRDQLLVTGIIGWPQNGDLTGVSYRIDKDSTSVPASTAALWDTMPICSVPEVKSADGNIYKAYGGLRLKKFIDAFGDNGKTHSICNNDFTDAMTQIAQSIVKMSARGCVDQPLADSNVEREGVQPDCQVRERIPCDEPLTGNCLASGYQETMLRECKDAAGLSLNPENPLLDSIPEVNRPCWTFSLDTSLNGCGRASQGQKISVLSRSGTVEPPGTMLMMKCRTQPSAVIDPSQPAATKKKLGATCDVGSASAQGQSVFNSAGSECARGLCLKPANVSATPVDTSAYCSATCSKDSDCNGATRDPNDPNDKTCKGGYACGVSFVVGPLCCQKVCICKDFLSDKGVMVPFACDSYENNGGTACNPSP